MIQETTCSKQSVMQCETANFMIRSIYLVYDKNFADFIAFVCFLLSFFLTGRQIETAIFFIARRTMLDLANGIFFNGCLRDIVARVSNKFFLPFANVIQYVLRSVFARYNEAQCCYLCKSNMKYANVVSAN